MIYTGIILTPLFSCMIKLFVLRGKAWPYSWCSKSSYVSRVLLVEIIIVRHTVYVVINTGSLFFFSSACSFTLQLCNCLLSCLPLW